MTKNLTYLILCIVAVLTTGWAYTSFAGPTNLEDCRAQAARDARSDVGARAALLDCSRKFSKLIEVPSEVSEVDCVRKGWYYEPNVMAGSKCMAPCTSDERVRNRAVRDQFEARQRVPEDTCLKRNDRWDADSKLCRSRAFEPIAAVMCGGWDD
jgi:hypothetical protein